MMSLEARTSRNIKNTQWFLKLYIYIQQTSAFFPFFAAVLQHTPKPVPGWDLRIVAGAGNFNSSLEGRFKLPNVQWTAPCTNISTSRLMEKKTKTTNWDV